MELDMARSFIKRNIVQLSRDLFEWQNNPLGPQPRGKFDQLFPLIDNCIPNDQKMPWAINVVRAFAVEYIALRYNP